jgi:predicted Na+-dependent transporter
VFLGLDSALCLVATVVAMALAPVIMPPLVLGLLGVESDLSILDFALRLAVMVAASLAGGLLIRGLLGPAWIERRADWIDGALVLSILVVEIGVMDGVQDVVLEHPAKALGYLLAAFALNVAMSLAALLAAPWLDRRRLLSAALLLGNRNGMLLLATFGAGAEPDVRLFLVLIQVPLATMPYVFSLLCRRAGPPL